MLHTTVILADVTTIRLGWFAAVLMGMTVWEWLAPRRRLTVRKGPRWVSHLALAGINSVAIRLVLPVTLYVMAADAQERGWGLLNMVAWPAWAELALGVIALDLVVYLQHVMFHAVPLFWRFHQVHHADLDFDVTTGVRFHTLEILTSAVIKMCAVLVFGPSALAVLIFEVTLNATAMFNHSNVWLPLWLDRLLRYVVVTPDMHRVHHSVIRRETNSNFGFNLPWWDYLLGTYRDQPAAGHEGMTIGLAEFRTERQIERLPGILWLPTFSGDPPLSDDREQTT